MVTTENQVFIQQVNDAFLNGDTGFFEAHVVDDVRWTVVGSPSIEGKAAFMAEIESMKAGPAPEFSITNVIVHEASAAVEGTMTINKAGVTKRYAFCDVYRLSGSGTGKIEEISTYMIELDPGGAS